MSRKHPSWRQLSMPLSGAPSLVACGNAPNDELLAAVTAPLQSALGSSTATQGACDAVATAGAGWLDTFIPVSTGVDEGFVNACALTVVH